jgi:hypothetical protein
MNWYYAEGRDKPLVTDEMSSKKWIYVRRNIEEFEREDETDPTIKEKFYRWEEIKLPKDTYPIYQQEQANAANIDYIAMINDIDLDDDEEEW